jgi:hypothetical protein
MAKMAIIFFGGLVMGFLIGWLGLALLTMTSLGHQDRLVAQQATCLPEDNRD